MRMRTPIAERCAALRDEVKRKQRQRRDRALAEAAKKARENPPA
jgi:hypothetical protein